MQDISRIDRSKVDMMNEAEVAALIELHNRKYWVENSPEISDDDYDYLMRRLHAVNPAHPLLDAVHTPMVAASGKVRHSKPMLSLAKVYSLDELVQWTRKYSRSNDEKLLIQPKYDGISASWTDGVLATRGDGEIGEDISYKAPLIEIEHPEGTFPLSTFKRQARGEIVIRDDDFTKIYSHVKNRNGRVYKNSRNAVAGIMGLKDITDMVAQGAKLTFVDYSLHSWKTSAGSIRADWQGIVEHAESLPYPMDGLVIKIADEKYADSLESTAHHPHGQVAFKFSGVRSTSVLRGVEWSFGKNCLTPVALIDEVQISGTSIKRASLHNLQNILDKDLHIGDSVVVERAGDVIPYIVSSEPGTERKLCVIEDCPSCGTKLVYDKPELRCPNPECPETRLQLLLAAVRNIGIERLGEPNIRKMMKTLNVRNLKDIFSLTLEDIRKLEGFQELSASNLFNEIQAARSVADWQILAAVNIRGIGPNIAKSILTEYTLDELRKLTSAELSAIDGIGPERAGALENELKRQGGFIDELLSCLHVSVTKDSAGSKANLTVCFTGKMPEKRSYYEELARGAGYEPTDAVTSALSLLVAADDEIKSSKISKALKAGVKIMKLGEWLEDLKNKTHVSYTESSPVFKHRSEDVPEKKEVSGNPDSDDLFIRNGIHMS